jgi:tripartite-type tricarboxylate transporter receptor subunit TctC
VLDSFKQVVTAPDGTVRGVPFGAAMGGGIFYNRKIYADLGLSVPKSWDEFMANNAKIAEAGKVPVITTFGDTWTSQLFVLGDFFNVQAEVPTFAEGGVANVQSDTWFGLAGPAGMPRPLVDRIAALFREVMQDPWTRTRLAALGAEPLGLGPDEFRALMQREVAEFRRLAAVMGIRPE